MPNAIESAIEDGAAVLHKATDPRNKKARNLFTTAVILLLFGNAGLQGIDMSGFLGADAATSNDMVEVKTAVRETLDNTAILAAALSAHITNAEGVFADQTTTNQEIVQNLVDLMDTINYIDIKTTIDRALIQLDSKIASAEARKEEVILEKARSVANNTLSPELDQLYRNQLRFLDEQMFVWAEEIRIKKQQLERGRL